jgi:hypothetical protein
MQLIVKIAFNGVVFAEVFTAGPEIASTADAVSQ